MIASIAGTLIEVESSLIVVEVNGIAYEVHISSRALESLPAIGQQVKLYINVQYREDDQRMYGFLSKPEKALFKLLIEKVSGVGPKIALAIVNSITPDALQHAVQTNDIDRIAQCPGIGKKTAQRLIVELRGQFGELTSAHTLPIVHAALGGKDPSRDATAALVALGFKLSDADRAVRQTITRIGADHSVETIVKQALAK